MVKMIQVKHSFINCCISFISQFNISDHLGDVEIVDIKNLNKNGNTDVDIIDSGRPSSINSGDKTITTVEDSEDDFSNKSFKDGYEVVSGEVSIVHDTDDESSGLRDAVINDLNDIPNLAFKIENTESKKSYNDVIAPNSVKEKIPYFESLGHKPFSNVLDEHHGMDESQHLKSIDENIDSMEFDNIETLDLSSSDPPGLLESSLVSSESMLNNTKDKQSGSAEIMDRFNPVSTTEVKSQDSQESHTKIPIEKELKDSLKPAEKTSTEEKEKITPVSSNSEKEQINASSSLGTTSKKNRHIQ